MPVTMRVLAGCLRVITCQVQLCELITPQHQHLQPAAACDAQRLQLGALQQHLQDSRGRQHRRSLP